MTPEYGAASQLEKIDMLDFADIISINKFDKRGALDALRDVKKQYQRNQNLWDAKTEDMPVYGTIASQFNDPGTNALYRSLMDALKEKANADLNSGFETSDEMSEKIYIIPPKRIRYLSEIADNNRDYDQWVESQSKIAQRLYNINETIESVKTSISSSSQDLVNKLEEEYNKVLLDLDPHNLENY